MGTDIMRYRQQFHSWPLLYWVSVAFGVVCLYFDYSLSEPKLRITLFASGLVGLVGAWVLRKDRTHYLEITNDRITHHGFRNWTLLKTEVTRVEPVRKRWTDDYDLFLKIYASGKEYHVDPGFLIDEQRLKEIARAIRFQGSA